MDWWEKMMHPARRVWHGVAVRLGIRRHGLLKLRHNVKACEYEDVRIMWEMLERSETGYVNARSRRKKSTGRKKSLWNCFRWATCGTSYVRRSF